MNIRKVSMIMRLRLASMLVIGTSCMLLGSAQVHAEYLGLVSGRSANISSLHSSSVEAGFSTGDLELESDSFSYQSFGARFNFRTSADLMIFFDIAQVDIEDADGLGYGAGLFYQIKGIAKNNDFAVKLSYHTTKQEEEGFIDVDFNVLAIEALLSGDKIGESDLRWYANFGIHKLEIDEADFDETEFGFGAGVVTDTSFGEFYGGIDLIGEIVFGLGVRYHLQ